MQDFLYHGSYMEIPNPNLDNSRIDIDFGCGFYLTKDPNMACKWACHKNKSILNAYRYSLDGLRIKHMSLNEEWLKYVIANRTGALMPFSDINYDVIIGPTADDKMFNIIDLYNDGYISTENALKIINILNYSEQIVFKDEAAIKKALIFDHSKVLFGQEKQYYINQFRQDRIEANEKVKQELRRINGVR